MKEVALTWLLPDKTVWQVQRNMHSEELVQRLGGRNGEEAYSVIHLKS